MVPLQSGTGGRMCFHRGMKRLFLGFSVGLQMLAQVSGLSLPPSGRNQEISVTQGIGPVQVTISHSSPAVHGPIQPGGPEIGDRRGKIWGQLVPVWAAYDCRAGRMDGQVFETDGRVGRVLLPRRRRLSIPTRNSSSMIFRSASEQRRGSKCRGSTCPLAGLYRFSMSMPFA